MFVFFFGKDMKIVGDKREGEEMVGNKVKKWKLKLNYKGLRMLS